MNAVKTPATRLVCKPFHCAKLSRNVILTSIHFFPGPDESLADESDQEVVFDCADKKNCGVCLEWGRFRSYEWEKCSHPELRKTVSE
jgi:hypothetical protein